ncbi:MAG: methyltransferase domain-containing protein [Armatimonadetes bacterium]|nr:methyltransferase domain-containing protein [Armatimonadota bacterium]
MSAIRPVPGSLSIRTCARVATYRQLARELPEPGDTVIEIGSAEGHTTHCLARRAGRVIAVEKSAACLDIARERCARHGNITWVHADAFDLGDVQSHTGRADLVFIDIGGSSWAWLALKLAGMYRQMFQPRVMVIRNVGLNDFVCAVDGSEPQAPPGHWRMPRRPREGE